MKETLRRLSVVIVWLATIFCCFLVYSINADWWFYLIWCCFGIVGHNVVNWIFQKDSGENKFEWESFVEVIFEALSPPWWLLCVATIIVFISFRPVNSPTPLLDYDDIAKRMGFDMGRVFAAIMFGYVIAVIFKAIAMLLRSSFVRKIFGG